MMHVLLQNTCVRPVRPMVNNTTHSRREGGGYIQEHPITVLQMKYAARDLVLRKADRYCRAGRWSAPGRPSDHKACHNCTSNGGSHVVKQKSEKRRCNSSQSKMKVRMPAWLKIFYIAFILTPPLSNSRFISLVVMIEACQALGPSSILG
jgi:hypothetical protein